MSWTSPGAYSDYAVLANSSTLSGPGALKLGDIVSAAGNDYAVDLTSMQAVTLDGKTVVPIPKPPLPSGWNGAYASFVLPHAGAIAVCNSAVLAPNNGLLMSTDLGQNWTSTNVVGLSVQFATGTGSQGVFGSPLFVY